MNSVHRRERSLLEGTVLIIASALSGESLARRLSACLRLKAEHVVVDFGDAAIVDSSTLTSLKRAASRMSSRGGRLSVVCTHPRVASLLDLTLLSHSFRVFDSLDEAIRQA